jgi:hypothetical protein
LSARRAGASLRAYLGELLMIAAIVATLLGVPLTLILAGLLVLLDVSLHACLTFGGKLNAYQGAAAWWFIAFLPTLAYAAWVMPWEPERP